VRAKVRYKGLAKNTAQLFTLFSLDYLPMARRTLMQEGSRMGGPATGVSAHRWPERQANPTQKGLIFDEFEFRVSRDEPLTSNSRVSGSCSNLCCGHCLLPMKPRTMILKHLSEQYWVGAGKPWGVANETECPAVPRICHGTAASVGSKSVAGRGIKMVDIIRFSY
jgi:hypothetical protein